MGSYIKSVFWLLSIALLVTCKSNQQEPDPLTDGKPRIIEVNFLGIPKENIKIDQKNFLITVTVPPKLQANLSPTFTLTDNAKVLPKTWSTLFLGNCPECKAISLANKQDASNTPLVTYTVKLLPSAPLAIGTLNSPIEYQSPNSTDNEVFIPMLNLYANPMPLKIIFRNRTNQQTVVLDSTLKGEGAYALRGWGSRINHLHIQMNYVTCQMGQYDVEIVMGSGERLVVPQPIIIKKGPFRIINWDSNEGPPVKPGEEFTVEGQNLFAGDISMALIDSLDQVTPLSGLVFEPCGQRVSVSIPETVRYGHYVLRVERIKGETMQECRRLHLKAKPNAPFEIVTLGEYLGACSIKGPVVIPRNEWTNITINGEDKKARFKFVSLSSPSQIYYIKAYLQSYSNPETDHPMTFIPGTIPAGEYKVVLQTLDDNDKVLDKSPPFWRIVQLY